MAGREIIIDPRRGGGSYWRELWQFRELFYLMTWRDVMLRYRQMSIGFLWVVMRPVLTMLVFTYIFGRLARLPSGGVPYPLLVFSAMLPWQFFATSFADAGSSLSLKEAIVAKVYFPRLMIPVGSVVVSFVDLLAGALVLVAIMVWYRFVPDWRLAVLPLFMLLLFCFALGAGLWISMLSARYKDFRNVIPFVVQMSLYLSPVGFSSSFFPPEWRVVYAVNPLVGVIDGFRWSILGTLPPGGLEMSVGMAGGVSFFLIATGIVYFRRNERSLAEFL